MSFDSIFNVKNDLNVLDVKFWRFFFDNLDFWNTLFSKLYTIFDDLFDNQWKSKQKNTSLEPFFEQISNPSWTLVVLKNPQPTLSDLALKLHKIKTTLEYAIVDLKPPSEYSIHAPFDR